MEPQKKGCSWKKFISQSIFEAAILSCQLSTSTLDQVLLFKLTVEAGYLVPEYYITFADNKVNNGLTLVLLY